MSIFQFNYPKPKIIETLSPAFFDEVRDHITGGDGESSHGYIGLGLAIRNGKFNVWSSYRGEGLFENAQYLAELALSHCQKPSAIGLAQLDVRYSEKQSNASWHQDGMKKEAFGIVVSDKHPTLFAHGKRLGFDYIHAKDQRVKAQEIADSLTIYRPEPYEVVLFDRRMMHTKPPEDLEDRIFIRLLLK